MTKQVTISKKARDKSIAALSKTGMDYDKIGGLFSLHKNTVGKICSKQGAGKNEKLSKKEIIDTIANINKDIETGVSYQDICDKYDLTPARRAKFANYGLEPVYSRCSDRLTDSIKSEYIDKGQTMTEISTNTAYIRMGKNKTKKYPKIGNRSAGGVFLPKTTIETIVRLREKKEYSFSKIAKELNAMNIKTVTDIDWTQHNVYFKYHAIKRLKLA